MRLAVNRSISEAYGRPLWATANERQGAAFTVTLPVEEEMSA